MFFTAEVFGLALALLCILSFLCLIAGESIFGAPSLVVASFFRGVFGYLAFPVLALLTFIGIKALIGFKVKSKALKKFLAFFFVYATLIGLIWQTVTAQSLSITTSLSEYLAVCYNSGISLAECTPGGVFLGFFAHSVAKFITPLGAYVIYAICLVVATVLLVKNKILNVIENAQTSAVEANEKKPKKSLKEKQEVEENSSDDDFVHQTQVSLTTPRRTVIFGGGEFEKKTPEEKKRGGSNVKVLFGSSAFNPTYSKEPYSNPLQPTSSYRRDYEADIDKKTQFVKSPYEQSSRSYQSTVGRVSEPVSMGYSEERVDIDVSEPEKDIYVFNTRGKSGERITPFERRVNGDGFATAGSSQGNTTAGEDDGYNVSRFSRGLSRGADFERNDRNPAGFERNDRNTTGFERNDRNPAGFERNDRNPAGFEGSDRNSTGFERNDRNPAGFERSDRNSTGFERSNRSFGLDRDGLSNDFSNEEPVVGNDVNENPIEGEQQSFGFNPVTRAIREGGQSSTVNSGDEHLSATSSDDFEDNQQGEVTPNYNGDGASLFGGSYFSAEEKQKPAFVRDKAHSSSTQTTQAPAPAPKQSIAQSSSGGSPIRGKQLSMSDIPEENQFINPIDNIPKNYKYAFPPINLLLDYSVDERAAKKNEEEQLKRAETICAILKNSNIDATIEEIKYGPAITRFELSIPPTVSVKRILEKYEDLNLWIAARDKIRLVAPIQGTSRIGIEVPNASPATVGLKGLIESREFKTAKQSSLSFCLGQDIVGRPVILDIAKMPHLLVAGATGTGKSVFLNTLLVSLIYKYSPEELRIILVDPKVVEFSIFRGIPNLMFNEIFTDNAKVCSMLEWAVQEMEERYQKLNEVLAKNIEEYNAYMEKKKGKKIPKILIIIDEFADLMNSSSERKLMENKISRLAAKARAAGIHLIMATQRPSADIMEGSIKTNFTSRIAFKMSSPTDAMVIMGEAGADKLLGRGDVLFRTSTMPSTERAQGCFVDTPEIDKVCRYVKDNNDCYYDELALEKILKGAQPEESAVVSGDFSAGEGGGARSDDELIKKAMRLAISTGNISISGTQRKLGIGFPKAGKLIDTLVEKGYISETVDNKTRKIFMTKEQFEETFGEPF